MGLEPNYSLTGRQKNLQILAYQHQKLMHVLSLYVDHPYNLEVIINTSTMHCLATNVISVEVKRTLKGAAILPYLQGLRFL